MQKLQSLNKKEIAFFRSIHVGSEAELQDELEEMQLYKTFLHELKKIERRRGYDPTEADVTNMIGYFVFDHFEVIEEFVYCFKDDLKEGAKRYFEYYY